VWAGTVGNCLVGPHVLPHQLTGNHYRDINRIKITDCTCSVQNIDAFNYGRITILAVLDCKGTTLKGTWNS
jgi:hypothetical protein